MRRLRLACFWLAIIAIWNLTFNSEVNGLTFVLFVATVGLVGFVYVTDLTAGGPSKHEHTAHTWDGYYEHCRCGASAGDRRNADGLRCVQFSDWPVDVTSKSKSTRD